MYTFLRMQMQASKALDLLTNLLVCESVLSSEEELWALTVRPSIARDHMGCRGNDLCPYIFTLTPLQLNINSLWGGQEKAEEQNKRGTRNGKFICYNMYSTLIR